MEGEAEFIFNKLWGEVDRHVCKDAKQLKESTHQRSQEIAMASVSNANHLNTFLLARGREGRESLVARRTYTNAF